MIDGGSDTLRPGSPCLHCVLVAVIEEYWRTYGHIDESAGTVDMDVTVTLAKIINVAATLIFRVEGAAAQEKLIGDLHGLIDAIVKAKRTGMPVKFEMGGNPVVN